MESSIAVFLSRRSACERLPTVHSLQSHQLCGKAVIALLLLLKKHGLAVCLTLKFEAKSADHPCGRGNSAISDA